MKVQKLACEQILDGLAAGAAAGEFREEDIRVHLSGCPYCSMAYAETTALRAAFRDLRTDIPPIPGGSVRSAVISRLASESAQATMPGRAVRRSLSYLAAAAVLVLAIGIVIAYLHSGASAVPDPPVTRLDPPPAPRDEPRAVPVDTPAAGTIPGLAPSGPVHETPVPGRIRNAGGDVKIMPAARKPGPVVIPEIRPRKCADGVELVWSDTGQGRYRVLKSHRPDDFTDAEVVVVAGTQWTDREATPGVRITYYIVE